MFITLQVLTIIVVAIAFVLALAHALELPGKMRLDKETYYSVTAGAQNNRVPERR